MFGELVPELRLVLHSLVKINVGLRFGVVVRVQVILFCHKPNLLLLYSELLKGKRWIELVLLKRIFSTEHIFLVLSESPGPFFQFHVFFDFARL